MATLIIPDDILGRIKTGIGYPIIDVGDIGLTNDQLIDDILYEHWMKYQEWNPLNIIKEYQVEAQFEFPFPNDTTFCVVDARLNNQYFAALRSGNPLVNEVMISSVGRYRVGSYGTRYDYEMTPFNVYKQIERQSVIDTYRAFRVDVDKVNRVVTGYSNLAGMLSITWGDYSTDWADVPFVDHTDLIRYLRGALMMWLGDMRNQGSINMEGEVDGNALIERGTTLMDAPQERWQQKSKVIIQRG